MGLYSLDDDERKDVAAIFENFPKLEVAERFKKALSEMTDKACDELTAYMQDEYVLRFEEIVEKQAKKVVEALLRGENLDSFGLQVREYYGRTGELYAYDGEKVREAIVRDFGEQIQTAEMLELRKDNERMRKDLEYIRQRSY